MHVGSGGKGVIALALTAALMSWTIPARAEEPPAEEPPMTFETTHTFSQSAAGIGSVASLRVVRTFQKPVRTVKLTIVGGQADDIGYVGNTLVTSIQPSCAGVGAVVSPVDVSNQATIDGNNVSFTLSATENCCCRTGWGSATEAGRADARFLWEVTFTNDKSARITATAPVIPDASRVSAGCVQYRSDLTGTVTKSGQPLAGVPLQFRSNRDGADTFTQPASPTDASGVATGQVKTRKQGTASISAANSDVTTTSPASISFTRAAYETPFRYTGYFIPAESEANGALVAACGLDRSFPIDFLFGRGVTMQGTGQTTDGRYVQPDYARNNAEHRTGTNKCFRYVACAYGASGRCVVADQSIAVDTTIIPMGANLDLQGYGPRRADDTGGAITGYHIDLFLGAGRAVLQGHTLRSGTITYVSGGGSCN